MVSCLPLFLIMPLSSLIFLSFWKLFYSLLSSCICLDSTKQRRESSGICRNSSFFRVPEAILKFDEKILYVFVTCLQGHSHSKRQLQFWYATLSQDGVSAVGDRLVIPHRKWPLRLITSATWILWGVKWFGNIIRGKTENGEKFKQGMAEEIFASSLTGKAGDIVVYDCNPMWHWKDWLPLRHIFMDVSQLACSYMCQKMTYFYSSNL